MPDRTLRYASYAVFSRDTGKIACWFYVDVFPGAETPAESFIQSQALTTGSKSSGGLEAELDMIPITAEVNTSASYVVDLGTRTLKEVGK